MEGYVYILEVKDITLPVCKIGVTQRTPEERCAEINKSSTGDFLWEVSNSLYVDKCHELEALVHQKLEPLRQKRREFFNISPKDAFIALMSIFDSQDSIKKIEDKTIRSNHNKTVSPKNEKIIVFSKRDSEYANILQLFTSVLGIKGRPFGQLNSPQFGMSDGNQGIQWNIVINSETGEIRVGVNLEGTENTGKWLISYFLQSAPDIAVLKKRLKEQDNIYISFLRDAWQGPARLRIKERFIGGKEYLLSEINEEKWTMLITEALQCLDENKNYMGRKKSQPVTLETDGRVLTKDISPHIAIWKHLKNDDSLEKNMMKTIDELKPAYQWMSFYCA